MSYITIPMVFEVTNTDTKETKFEFGAVTDNKIYDLFEQLIDEINRRKSNKVDVGFYDKAGNYKADLQPVENPVIDYGVENAETNAKVITANAAEITINGTQFKPVNIDKIVVNQYFNQKLFDYFVDNHNITLLQDEMQQIKNICYESFQNYLSSCTNKELFKFAKPLFDEMINRKMLECEYIKGGE